MIHPDIAHCLQGIMLFVCQWQKPHDKSFRKVISEQVGNVEDKYNFAVTEDPAARQSPQFGQGPSQRFYKHFLLSEKPVNGKSHLATINLGNK
jgi:hypothetical protein